MRKREARELVARLLCSGRWLSILTGPSQTACCVGIVTIVAAGVVRGVVVGLIAMYSRSTMHRRGTGVDVVLWRWSYCCCGRGCGRCRQCGTESRKGRE